MRAQLRAGVAGPMRGMATGLGAPGRRGCVWRGRLAVHPERSHHTAAALLCAVLGGTVLVWPQEHHRKMPPETQPRRVRARADGTHVCLDGTEPEVSVAGGTVVGAGPHCTQHWPWRTCSGQLCASSAEAVRQSSPNCRGPRGRCRRQRRLGLLLRPTSLRRQAPPPPPAPGPQ